MPAPPRNSLDARQLPNLSRYWVRCDGAVIREHTIGVSAGFEVTHPHFMSTHINDEGYPKVKLTGDDGKRRGYFVHKLVALAFLPEPSSPAHRYVLHRDDCRTNASWDNLRWGTHQDNVEDKRERGRLAAVARKLSVRDVRRIRRSPLSPPRLAKKLGLSISHVREIKNGRKWAAVA